MNLKNTKYGTVELEIDIGYSAVDSFIQAGYSVSLDRELTEDELDELQETYAGEIQMYAYENGSRNHN